MASGSTSPPAFASYDPPRSSWKTSQRSAPGASAKSSPTWPRLFPLSCRVSVARGGGPSAPCLRLLPAPVAGALNDGESLASWLDRRDQHKQPGRNCDGSGTPLPIAIALLPTPLASDGAAERARQLGGQRPSGAKRQVGLPEVIVHHLAGLPPGTGPSPAGTGRLLPTPDTGVSPRGHGRRGGRPGNGRQSGRTLTAAGPPWQPPGRPVPGHAAMAWGDYEPAIRRWEQILGHRAPPPAEPGPAARPRLSASFAEWMMGIPGLVTGVPGLSRTAQLRLIGNGVVPQRAAAALRLLIRRAVLGAPPGVGHGVRAAA